MKGGTRDTPKSIHVGFDGRTLTSPAAGVRRYVSSLIRALGSLDSPIRLTMLGGDPSDVPKGVGHVAEPPHLPTNAGWVLVGLPVAARRAGVDLLHAPAYTAPYWSPVPVVLTVHDVSYARHPQWFPYRRDWVRRAFYRASAERATLVITDSSFSAAEIQAAYAAEPARIRVVPLGVDESFTPSSISSIPLPAVAASPFLLHVGDLHERRNLGLLVDAVLEVRRREPTLAALTLLLAGVDRGVGSSVKERAVTAGFPEAVVLLGAVDEGVLRALYGQALALAYPSLYEGFGLPLLEAMACGTPIVAARAASIPEVVGDAGVLLDPYDIESWTRAIIDLGSHPQRRADFRARGLARARTFTWARTAQETYLAYREALELPRRAGRRGRFSSARGSTRGRGIAGVDGESR